jgi:hypothetical protein
MQVIDTKSLSSTSTQEALDKFWQQLRPHYQFVYDGVLDLDSWSNAVPRIAFLLKESNDDFTQIRNNVHDPRNGNSRLFWRNLNIWTYTIQCKWRGLAPSFEEALSLRNNPVMAISYVNIKKNHEKKAKSDWVDLRDYVMNDWPLLERQLQLIQAQIIVLCGTESLVLDSLVIPPLRGPEFSC